MTQPDIVASTRLRAHSGAPRRLRSPWANKKLIFGSVVLVGLFVMQWVTPLFMSYDGALIGASTVNMVPFGVEVNAALGFFPNEPGHLLGTDSQGRDIFTALLVGIPQTLNVGLIGAGLGVVAGALLGFTAGMRPGRVDSLICLLTDVALSIPGLAVLVVVASYITDVGVVGLGVIMALMAWPIPARVFRSQVLSLRESGYVAMAKLSGSSVLSIIVREMVPNLIPYIGATFVQTMSGVILVVTGLEALGLGNGRYPSLGGMISAALEGTAILRGMWWWWLCPVAVLIAIFLSLLSVTLGLDQVVNPKLRKTS
ncbi:ABC transporter permease [Pseudarthrobacter sp. Y6]|uniref:ABC transporter permease n=1 Tax=Pseudarthrobacter sp. Y6 TaxID=3418422 RepID=UPI003CF45558